MPIVPSFPSSSAKPITFTVTLPSSNWSQKVLTVSGEPRFVETGFIYTVCPDTASYDAYSAAGIYAEEVTAPGQMKFHCKKEPVSQLTVNVVRTEVDA